MNFFMERTLAKWMLEEVEFVVKNFKLGPKKIATMLDFPRIRVASQYHRLRKADFNTGIKTARKGSWRCPNLPTSTLGYIAGFIDGEGCLSLDIHWDKNGLPTWVCPMVSLSQIDPRPLMFIHTALKVPWNFGHPKQAKTRFRPQTTLSVTGFYQVKDFLQNLIPYLVLKKQPAEIMIQLAEQHIPRYWSLNDWKLVLQHAQANKLPSISAKRRIKKLQKAILVYKSRLSKLE